MASTYTTGFSIEKIGSGEQAGSWGTTSNHNWDIVDRLASYKAVALSDASTATLTVRETSPGSGTENLQDGMYRAIKFTGSLSQDCTVTIAPDTAPAWFIIENAAGDDVILSQGSGANVTVQNGKNVIVYCDGAGGGAAVVDALADLQIGTLEVTGVAAIDGATQFNSTITVGVNDTGYDVKLFGATSGAYMLWDESADDLILAGAAGLSVAGGSVLASVDVTGVATAATFEPDGDTAASDNAAIGYTSAEGLILTGQGSTNDVTIKNDADADVITIATGGTSVDVVGDITASTLNADGDTSAADNAAIGYTSAEGLILTGQGSTSDITFKNDADGTVFTIPTGSDDVLFADDAKVIVGTSSDGWLVHDGSHTTLVDNGAGNLTLKSNGAGINFQKGDSETMCAMATDGAVTLYYDNAAKLTTSAAGISVTGDVLLTTANAGIYLGVTSATAANHLDDYEEGTATLTLTGSTAAPTSAVTVTSNYVKIGRVVTIRFAFGNVSTVGATGTVQVTGLPFSAASAGGIGSPMKNAAGSDGLYSVWYCAGTTLQDFYIRNDAGWAAQPITAVSDCSFTNHLVYITAS